MKLKLDERLIRKGRPVGLPYTGSKKKISKKIVAIIMQNFGKDKVVYDIFGGGGAITFECLINDLNVVYNDKDPAVVAMLELILTSDREFIKTLIMTRDEFFEIKDKENKTPCDELKLLINSFGNNCKSYLYSKQMADIKYHLAMEIIEKHDTFVGYKQTSTYKECVKNVGARELSRVQQLQALEQVARITQLEQVERLQQVEGLQMWHNLDYKEFSDVKGAILYLDPPYEDAGYYNKSLDHKELYNWAVNMSKDNIVLMSGYKVSDNRFEVVYEFPTARSTFRQGTSTGDWEKLFMVL